MSDNEKKDVVNLDLSVLVEPDRPTVTMRNGEVYECALKTDFGARELARFKRCLKVINDNMGILVDPDDCDEERAEAFDTAVHEMLELVLPGVTAEELNSLSILEKAQVFQFWSEETGMVPEDEAEDEAVEAASGE
jgi:hypothetical protein